MADFDKYDYEDQEQMRRERMDENGRSEAHIQEWAMIRPHLTHKEKLQQKREDKYLYELSRTSCSYCGFARRCSCR